MSFTKQLRHTLNSKTWALQALSSQSIDTELYTMWYSLDISTAEVLSGVIEDTEALVTYSIHFKDGPPDWELGIGYWNGEVIIHSVLDEKDNEILGLLGDDLVGHIKGTVEDHYHDLMEWREEKAENLLT